MNEVDGNGLAHLIMQIFTVIVFVGTIGVSLFIGKLWRKDRGY